MPTTYPRTVVLTPWCDPATFSAEHGIPLDVAAELVEGATWLLTALTDGKLTAGGCYLEDYAALKCAIRLQRTPVAVIYGVERVDGCGRGAEPVDDYCMLDASLLSVCGGDCGGSSARYDYRRNFGQAGCGCGDSPRYRVRYKVGNNLPPGAGSMACLLAEEALKAKQGQACQLPERIQTVTRQGVSWTIFDPQDFLTRGGTGISAIDLWLSATRKTFGGTVRDPLEGYILNSQHVACQADLGGPFEYDSFTAGFDRPDQPFIDTFTTGTADGNPFVAAPQTPTNPFVVSP